MLKGSKHLKIAGILEIVIGALMLLFTWMLVGAGDFSSVLNEGTASNALLSIVILYGFHIFEIIVGLAGVACANKKSLLTLVLGAVLFVINLWEFFSYSNDIMQIVIHALTLVVPYYYLHNAYRNYKG